MVTSTTPETMRAGLLAELRRIERWAGQEAHRSHRDPEWRAQRFHSIVFRDDAADSYRLALAEREGEESAYSESAERLSSLRARLEEAPSTQPVPGVLASGISGLLSWVEAERKQARRAPAQRDGSRELAAVHARGREAALDAIRVELRAFLGELELEQQASIESTA